MELMLVVWAVSVLSSIKLFVESYTLLCVLAVMFVYLFNKIHFKQIINNVLIKGRTPDIREGDVFTLSESDSIGLEVAMVPAGDYTATNVYPSSGKMHATHTQSNVRYLLDLTKVKLSLTVVGRGVPYDKVQQTWAKPIRTSGWIAVVLILCNTLLPSDTTMKYMAGAYLLQTTYQSDIVQTAAPLAKQAVLNQLKTWAKDNPDIDQLVSQAKGTADGVLKQ